jgi:hypothetical protein
LTWLAEEEIAHQQKEEQPDFPAALRASYLRLKKRFDWV